MKICTSPQQQRVRIAQSRHYMQTWGKGMAAEDRGRGKSRSSETEGGMTSLPRKIYNRKDIVCLLRQVHIGHTRRVLQIFYVLECHGHRTNILRLRNRYRSSLMNKKCHLLQFVDT